MRPRRQADQQHSSVRIAETGHRFAPVLPIKIGPPLHTSHLAAIGPQTWTETAGSDLPVQNLKWITQHAFVPHNEKRMQAKGLKSPEVVLMVVAGLAVAILGPYSLYLLMPHAPRVSSGETKSAPPGIDLDISELDTLPDSLRDGAMLLLTAETPELPESIANLAVATGEEILRPVSEAVEETQPVLYWSAAFGEPPYTVSISDDKGLVIARAQGIQNTSWMMLMPLRRGGEYTWLITSPTAKLEQASFRVLDDGQATLWRAMLTAHKDSHLVIGLIAQQLGMLAIAEREYTELTQAFPDSTTAALLLNNITELRNR
jgi:hypothetical protein